ncbi:alanine racemase [Vibrio algivorus]|uniref:Alanine racemase n=1 Tax=Vibrio algivorus TaxID=1667024 RepID=A0ABQ6EMC7_9VIBR|nr:alanine racemase [Vibrio algivorus]GLT13969.1 alanine racemase [Vibrio algivorus]
MARPTKASIDLAAFRHNYRVAKAQSPNSKAVAIIKADAYGHGAVKLAHSLSEADAFGVACIEEAIELREAGIKQPILLLEGFFEASELELIQRHHLWTALHSQHQIEAIKRQPESYNFNVWLKLDSGMHRLGFSPQDYPSAFEQLSELPQVDNIVHMTHFACADELDKSMTQSQLKTCKATLAQLKTQTSSFANSAATLAHPSSHSEQFSGYTRPGIMLYGADPLLHPNSASKQLIPVMTLTSKIIAIREVKAQESVGYGERYRCERNMKIGTVAIGYADGYPRHAKDGTPVMVDGIRTQLVGRVSMDMLTVDLTDIPNADIGSTVELWGKNVKSAEVAHCCDTIPYTLFTGITRRVYKEYSE